MNPGPSLEETERRWRAEVYAGDTVAEFTPRAVIAGVILGVLIMSQNVYLGLKTGSTEAGSILSSILCFAMFRAVTVRLTVLENNIAQSVSTAAGSIGIIASAIPALSMLGYSVAPWQLFIWLLSVACLGLFFAVPFRRQLVVAEGLTFPTGTACAATISAMHAHGDQSGKKAKALGLTALVSGALTWFRDGVPALVPSLVSAPVSVGKYLLEDLSMGFYVSPVLLGVGVLAGIRVGLSLLIGGIVSWIIMGPALVEWGVLPEFGGRAVREWMMWPAIALMIASGFTSLALRGTTIRRSLGVMKGISTGGGAGLDISGKAWWAGLAVSAIVVVASLQAILQVPLWLGAVAVGLSFILSTVAMRAYGETDVSPVGTMGHSNQIAAGMLLPGQQVPNLAAGSVSAGCSDISASVMQVFKTGHLLGATPRRQIFAQLVGVAVGTLTAVLVLGVLTAAHEIGSDELPAPGAFPWKGMAELVARGTDALPPHSTPAMVAGALGGILLTLLARTRAGRFLPSPLGIGIGLILPGFYSLTIFLGSLAGWFLGRKLPSWSDTHLTPIASGAIAGEAITGILIAILSVTGVIGG